MREGEKERRRKAAQERRRRRRWRRRRRSKRSKRTGLSPLGHSLRIAPESLRALPNWQGCKRGRNKRGLSGRSTLGPTNPFTEHIGEGWHGNPLLSRISPHLTTWISNREGKILQKRDLPKLTEIQKGPVRNMGLPKLTEIDRN